MDIPMLYALAEKENIGILRFPLPNTGSMSVMDEWGQCSIGMDPGVLDGGALELDCSEPELFAWQNPADYHAPFIGGRRQVGVAPRRAHLGVQPRRWFRRFQWRRRFG